MDILLYLTELLQTRKTVGVVGLGTFYKKKLPGKYDEAIHAFVPPSFSIAFTTELKENEELANYINEKRNISTESANYYIGEFAERIQSQLAEIQEADVAPIGLLKIVDGETVLVATETSNIGNDFYGLPTITDGKPEETAKVEEEKLAEIIAENNLEEENPGQETVEENILALDEQETFEEITEVKTPETKTYHQLNEDPPVIETAEQEEQPEEIIAVPPIVEKEVQPVYPTPVYVEEEEKKGMPFFLKFLIAILIIVALGAVVYFVNPQFFKNYFNKNYAGQQDQNTPVTVAPDTLGKMVDTSKGDSLTKNNEMVTLVKDSVTKTENKIDSSKVTTYEILVSAVATDKKANSIIANLAKEGIKAKKIRLSKTMINISAGTFLAEYPAKLYRDSLRKKLRNEGIYIQPINPKK
ncbi:MAG: hypothetical protein EOO96_07810 [Pedobacter sp.]|nr:MAG: hypothetical protein EOO96_07810 [Pedobacter sp.]